jgi:hypothetical protein
MSIFGMNPGRHVLQLDSAPGLFALDGLETGSAPKLTVSGSITMHWGAGMPAVYVDWLRSAMSGTARPCSGRILTLSMTNSVEVQRDFADATITRIQFPRLDASSKEAAFLRVTMAARSIHVAAGDGSFVSAPINVAHKKWLPSAFTFEMGSLPTESVDLIESIVITPPAAPREITFRVAAQYAAPFLDAALIGKGYTTEILFHSNTYPALLGRLEFPLARVVAVEDGKVTALTMDTITKASVRLSPGAAILHWSR